MQPEIDRASIIEQVVTQMSGEFRANRASLVGQVTQVYDAYARSTPEQRVQGRAIAASKGGERPATFATGLYRAGVLVADAMTTAADV